MSNEFGKKFISPNEHKMTCENNESDAHELDVVKDCIVLKHLMLDDGKALRTNSDLLTSLADSVMLRYKDLIVERKFTDIQTLAEV